MLKKIHLTTRRWLREVAKWMIARLPRNQRFKIIRSFADCNPNPSERLILKIAETKEELEACFALLHDARIDLQSQVGTGTTIRVTFPKK